jgi:hypothetical protein
MMSRRIQESEIYFIESNRNFSYEKTDQQNFTTELSDEQKNQQAALLIADVYDTFEKKSENRNKITIFLARLVFCLFADATGIFRPKQFETYLRNHTTSENLNKKLLLFFETLKTPIDKRNNHDIWLSEFPLFNTRLFHQKIIDFPSTNSNFRETLIKCCEYDWSFISPVIFGSLFQAVMHEADRRTLGAHYTSERNIWRLLRPLFLNNLQEEFENVKNDKKLLEKFRKKLSSLTFLDPACGCGNFLVVTYRELRLLDIEIIRIQNKGYFVLDVNLLNNVLLNQFYGCEIDPTSAMIAEVAMWLTQHQLNMKLELEFGKTVATIPLVQEANILNVNALETEWKPKPKGKAFDFILGNPPFVGKQFQSQKQKKDIDRIFNNVNGTGVLDYVTCWYVKAAEYIQASISTQCAFVSTNSISQGEQTGILWNILFTKYHVKINFAHQTFKWSNEAEGMAAVHCVIVGFGIESFKHKYIFEYSDINGEPEQIEAKNINPYLVQGNDTTILKRRKPICKVPEISFGSMPNDGGHLLLTDDEKNELISNEPYAEKWIRPLISAHEYLNGKVRWCLWLVEINPNDLKSMSLVYKRVQEVKKHRESSNRPSTNKLASTPFLFGEIRQPDAEYIAIPRVSSENRRFIPISFFQSNFIVSDSCLSIPNAKLFHFGILTSTLHMTWVRYVCGRLESRYRYSNEIVYNNFPFPKDVKEKQITRIENAVNNILEIRKKYIETGSTLAHLYNPSIMPVDLLKAHQSLDKLVDKCYREAPFASEPKRIEFLFELYEKYTVDLFTVEKKKKERKKKTE